MIKKTLLVRALGLAFGAAALGAVWTAPAYAQSNATGNIFGSVDTPAGATVVVQNAETGLRRTLTPDASGRYQATALPPGHYKVELQRDGKTVQSSETDVLLGQGADVSFAAASAQTVQVTGRRASRIDVSNTNNGAVFTSRELQRLPVQTNITSIALLAPNTVSADSAYGGASFGGSGASENSFYVNGFPITNPKTQLGSLQLPFGAIGQSSVITGGFGAEFGRSIGGVVNVTTKSGTNNWEVGATYSLTPNSLRSNPKNIYYEKTGYPDNAETDGKLHYRRDNSSHDEQEAGFYVGGPLIQDKLFMFVALDQVYLKDGYLNRTYGGSAATTIGTNGWSRDQSRETRYTAKFDWNINDDHRLEWTSLGDNTRQRQSRYGYVLNGALADLNGSPNDKLWSEQDRKNADGAGGNINMLKYTGNLTQDLTLTALYGELSGERVNTYTTFAEDGGIVPPLVSVPPKARRVPALDAQNLYVNHNRYGTPAEPDIEIPGTSKVKASRLDLEYKLGDHTLRAGIDSVKLSLTNAGQYRTGGSSWSYQKVANPNVETQLSTGVGGIVGNFGGYGTQGYYAAQTKFTSVTDASEKQSAAYIEDKWKITRNFLLNLGLRTDSYSNTNGDGQKFLEMKNQIAPRVSASWDVNGDASLKVFGSAGRYYLQLPTQVAARAASRSTLTRQAFTYTGIDPATGVPTGLVAIHAPFSPDGEYGQAKNPASVVVKDLKSNYQDEVTLGFEKVYSPELNFGAKFTYRKLGAGIDDNCDTRRLYQYAVDHGIPVVSKDFMSCYIFNPGEDVTVWIDGHDANGNPIVSGKGQYAHFTAAEIGNPKAERKYTAVDLFLEHPFRNGWFGRVNYTWSRSKGNMEGQTRSDSGQTDIGTSAGWDYPEFAPHTYGLLPNDREHALKSYGYVEVTKEWSVGWNALIQSGRPKVCLGTDPVADAGDASKDPYGGIYGGPGYGAEYMYCGGKPVPRGSIGRLPTEKRLDLSLAYKPAYLKDLTLKVDVFNVFNSQSVLSRQETYDDGSGENIEPNYGEARDLQAPRSVKLSVEYNHRF